MAFESYASFKGRHDLEFPEHPQGKILEKVARNTGKLIVKPSISFLGRKSSENRAHVKFFLLHVFSY
jgi:hypothetical protein